MESSGFLLRHGYSVTFAFVLADQLGVPVPAAAILIAAGAFAGSGQLSLVGVASVAVIASVAAHSVWYEAARRGRGDVLGFVCRISLEPDLCARGARDLFARWGASAILIANFAPGFAGVVAQPIAATTGMSRPRFLALNLLGALLWVAAFAGVGYIFSANVEHVLAIVAQLGVSGLQLLAVILVVYVGWKMVRRQLVFRELRMARITPEELKRRLDAGEPTVVLDLRHAMEFAAEPGGIPGALRMSPDELDARFAEISGDREIVLYCT